MGGAPNGDPVGLTVYYWDPALPAGHSHHEQTSPATSESSPERWLTQESPFMGTSKPPLPAAWAAPSTFDFRLGHSSLTASDPQHRFQDAAEDDTVTLHLCTEVGGREVGL